MNPGSTLLLLLGGGTAPPLPAPPTITGVPRYGPATYDGPMGSGGTILPSGPTPTLLSAIVAWWKVNGFDGSIAPIYGERATAGKSPPYVTIREARRVSTFDTSHSASQTVDYRFRCYTAQVADAERLANLAIASLDFLEGVTFDNGLLIGFVLTEENPDVESAPGIGTNIVFYKQFFYRAFVDRPASH